jgi:biofilm protein TabA
MLHASLNEPGTYESLLVHTTWLRAIEWLCAIPADIPLGTHRILGDQMFASVQEYETLSRAEARFESHQKHVDLQSTLIGEELIDWCPRSVLSPDGGFADDVQFWHSPTSPFSTLVNTPTRFSIFFPTDAHRPKVRGGTSRVRKLVIKVDMALLN